MEEIRIKIRGKRHELDAIQCIASHIIYPNWWNFRSKDGIKYDVHLISEKNGVKTFGVQTELDSIIHGLDDFEEKPKKKWYQFWKC